MYNMSDIIQTIKNEDLVIPLLGAPGAELSKTTLKENLSNSEIQYSSVSMLIDKFQPDGIFPMMDLTLEVEALGIELKFPENESPSVKKHPLKNKEDLETLKKKWSGVTGRMNVPVEVIEGLAKKYSIVKGGYVIGPFTMAGELMGPTVIGVEVSLNPDFVLEILDFTTQIINEYIRSIFEAGADMIAILEPLAMICTPQEYIKFSLEPCKKLISDHKNRAFVLHICGETNHIIEPMCNSGAVGLSLDSVIDFSTIKQKIPENIALIGNVDPTKLFLQGTPEEIAAETKKLKDIMKDTNNFILSSGCDIPLGSPMENIEAFMNAGRK